MLDIILNWDQSSVKHFFVKILAACPSSRGGFADWQGKTDLGSRCGSGFSANSAKLPAFHSLPHAGSGRC